jgi:hypothetical protein
MSRTVRRKNYEAENNTSWDRKGKKTNLRFTTHLWRGEVASKSNGNTWISPWGEEMEGRVFLEPEYRAMDKGERWHEVRMMHGESATANMRSPNSWYRLNRQKQNRSINKKEMIKWVQACGEYEPMFEANPRNCWWDWS